MTRLPFALAACALLLTTTAACGGGGDEVSGSGGESPSASASESSGSAAGDAECTGETQELEGADGVTLTVPADWTVQSLGEGEDTRFTSADGDSLEGQLVVQANGQTIDEGVSDVERLNSATQKDSEEEIDLPGFDDARVLQFSGEETGSTGSFVVGVGGGVRAIAYVIAEGDPTDETATAFGCMLTMQR